MLVFVSQWGHAATAILFAAIAVWLLKDLSKGRAVWSLVWASAMTSAWALLSASKGAAAPLVLSAEILRNLAWLGFMYTFWRRDEGQGKHLTVGALYGALLFVGVIQLGFVFVDARLHQGAGLTQAVAYSSFVLGMLFSVGALVLVHNLYTAGTTDTRSALRLPLTALSVIWVYDLNLYTVSYLSASWSVELLALRGLAVGMAAPLIALSANAASGLRVRLSRTATFQTLSLGAIGVYLLAMVVLNAMLGALLGSNARPIQVAFVFGCSVVALVLLPSARFRAWFKVKVAKHLFQHRYDYRAEWLRFSETLGNSGATSTPLETRVVQALADITESPFGCLMEPDGAGGLVVRSKWNWPDLANAGQAATPRTVDFFVRTGRIVELDILRTDAEEHDEEAAAVPEWLLADASAWAIVPLIHFGRLAGIVVLGRPLVARTLDWEDFDLLKVVGSQVATYLAEAHGQEALATAQRFDEFNRRFAFIMHDIKNLVSQLSLVARNAEKHAGNPDFQADMIVTLKSSVARMNDLLARLSQHNKAQAEEPRAIQAGRVLERVVAAKRMQHAVVMAGETELYLVADPVRLEQVVTHLAQNAIEASPATEPVTLRVRALRDEALIEVIDKGCGMSTHFIRTDLFKPFSSTKEGGFGVGAFEARSLVMAMGGRLDVQSREGEGTIFSIFLPLARDSANVSIDNKVQAA